jgi:hypothetical protein
VGDHRQHSELAESQLPGESLGVQHQHVLRLALGTMPLQQRLGMLAPHSTVSYPELRLVPEYAPQSRFRFTKEFADEQSVTRVAQRALVQDQLLQEGGRAGADKRAADRMLRRGVKSFAAGVFAEPPMELQEREVVVAGPGLAQAPRRRQKGCHVVLEEQAATVELGRKRAEETLDLVPVGFDRRALFVSASRLH